MVMHLRPYQLLALYHLRRCLEAGVRRLYVDLPTGTGKSTIAAAFAAQQLGQTQGARSGAGASAGPRPATSRDAQARRAGGGSVDGGQPHIAHSDRGRHRLIPHAIGDTGSPGHQRDAYPDGAHR